DPGSTRRSGRSGDVPHSLDPVEPVTVVANPAAGAGRARRLIPYLEEGLTRLGVDHQFVVSRDAHHAEEASREAAGAGAGAVMAVGGDGQVGACANGVVGTRTALAVVPAGSGNDFARSLGLEPRRPLASLRLLLDGATKRIDVVHARGEGWDRRFVCVGGAGFDSEGNEYANSLTRLSGTPRYVAAMLRTLVRFRMARFTIDVDGRTIRGPAWMVAVGNAPSYGGGMRIVPDAEVDDGLLDLCVVGAFSKPDFLRTFPKVFKGTHVAHPKVQTMRGRRAVLSADRPFEAYADGERLGPLPATFTVEPGALEVVAP
ncbi:MAG TPA: diacylglycerol kinase family protein, partial [Actinomycetota bacterium]|nr:diacylglycerol kinase family protein [Actinomycetota bacterium]